VHRKRIEKLVGEDQSLDPGRPQLSERRKQLDPLRHGPRNPIGGENTPSLRLLESFDYCPQMRSLTETHLQEIGGAPQKPIQPKKDLRRDIPKERGQRGPGNEVPVFPDPEPLLPIVASFSIKRLLHEFREGQRTLAPNSPSEALDQALHGVSIKAR
jgi:hypothetical protein